MLTQDNQAVSYDYISGDVQLPAGKTLTLESAPDGEEFVSYEAGEDSYTVQVYLRLTKN